MMCQEKKSNEYYMKEALKEAKKADSIGEIPVGAVIVHNDKIIARGHNKKETTKNPINHAEMIAIQKAARALGDWRLNECSLYVTLEPCPMCAGAIIQSRIGKVFYGTRDLKSGAVDSIINLLEFPWNHKVEVMEGILTEECMKILQFFFKKIRKK
ncbi:tRNA adenosine(34) deaminase TadA [Acholeplasma sp. OttesenSCG-928-E16]|nr:tRNA adenosine(34) deaminase TadA [Acholeplasma sp. OttesenSCG-928-E16]